MPTTVLDVVGSNTTSLPNFTATIDRRFFIEPFTQGGRVQSYLDRFPDEIYNKSDLSHLVRFMYVLLGMSGVGGLRRNALLARLKFEQSGIDLYDLDAFYGDPFKFGRILEEVYDEDPHGLLTPEEWNTIRAKDAKYRNRAIDFLNGVRAGNTPEGMRLIARSGLAHEVEIIENYKWLFDQHTDDRLDLPYYGKTLSTEEMIVLPRRELSRSEIQTLRISGTPVDGYFTITFNGHTTAAIGYAVTRLQLQAFLRALPNIGPDNLDVTERHEAGDVIYELRFKGTLTARDLPPIKVDNHLIGLNVDVEITVATETGGIEGADEVVFISTQDQKHLQEAIDRTRPMTTLPTVGETPGLRTRKRWSKIVASSEFNETIRYVTGSPNIIWPQTGVTDWIRSGKEKMAPTPPRWRRGWYWHWHLPYRLNAYNDEALFDPNYDTLNWYDVYPDYVSEHIGWFHPWHRRLFPFLNNYTEDTRTFYAYDSTTTDVEPPVASGQVDGEPLYNGHYPEHYYNLPGAPERVPDLRNLFFWASKERPQGIEYLEIDLGRVQPVNFVSFETTRKPFRVTLDYDMLDAAPRRDYYRATPVPGRPFATGSSYTFDLFPWHRFEFNFSNARGGMVYTQYLRFTFERLTGTGNPFRELLLNGLFVDHPWSIDVRNLRVGRVTGT